MARNAARAGAAAPAAAHAALKKPVSAIRSTHRREAGMKSWDPRAQRHLPLTLWIPLAVSNLTASSVEDRRSTGRVWEE